MEESLKRNRSETDIRPASIGERARGAFTVAIAFGGFLAGITAVRIFLSVAWGGVIPPIEEIGEILLVVIAAFLGFAGLAFVVKLIGVPVFSRDE